MEKQNLNRQALRGPPKPTVTEALREPQTVARTQKEHNKPKPRINQPEVAQSPREAETGRRWVGVRQWDSTSARGATRSPSKICWGTGCLEAVLLRKAKKRHIGPKESVCPANLHFEALNVPSAFKALACLRSPCGAHKPISSQV